MDLGGKARAPSEDQQQATAERIGKTAPRREEVKQRLRAGALPTQIDDPEYVDTRLKRLGVEADRPGLERVLGKNNLVPAATLERAAKVARCVARVRILDASGGLVGWGSGFMISPALFLTNNHVLRTFEEAAASRVEFNYQDGLDGKPQPAAVFDLAPASFFITDPKLDFTVVAVRASSATLASLSSFGHCRLIPVPGKALEGEYLNIIQHPNGEPKQVSLRENKLLARSDDFLHYETDTLAGSSGAPVFNDQWEVVALHHSGVPQPDGQGGYIAVDGGTWKPSMGEHRIKWIANEGVRISSIYNAIEKACAGYSGEKARLATELLADAASGDAASGDERKPPAPPFGRDGGRAGGLGSDCGCGGKVGGAGAAGAGSSSGATMSPGGTASWVIPVRVSVAIGDGGAPCPDGGVGDGRAAVLAAASSAPVAPAVAPNTRARGPMPGEEEAIAALNEARRIPYYSAKQDEKDRDEYYRGIHLDGQKLYDPMSKLLKSTHTTRLRYKPLVHVYPWLDLQPNMRLKSVYSGIEYDPEDIIREDLRVEAARAARFAELSRQESLTQESINLLEASLPYNCEHVVPQSWFDKQEPMRGDLHHLFACESGCNSFRSNTPYYDFADFEEAVRTDCGKREGNRFEPNEGKGAVARAVLYFILRYPGEVNATDAEYEFERIKTLISWHEAHEVTEYEHHRNSVAFRKQGNRNPLIDFPEIVAQINFRDGLGD